MPSLRWAHALLEAATESDVIRRNCARDLA
jgi:hypothetical protein